VPGFSQAPPPTPRVDFEDDAVWLAERLVEGDHLVGHSYGGVVALLAAVRADDLGSLTVIEPPATRVALDVPEVAAFARGGEELWANGPRDDPEAFMRAFLAAVGSDFDPPVPLPPQLLAGARLLVRERGPWEAEIPLETLAARRLPTLVVSGGHQPAFDAICDLLEQALDAERAVLPGFGHNAQLHPEFNRLLLDFVGRAAARDD
jgi:pimeloyl-ACP methyl ester carboxylesterase